MKTELRFTDARVPHIAILWDQSTTFRIRIDGQTVDSFSRYGDDQRRSCTFEQAQQVALEWFNEVFALHRQGDAGESDQELRAPSLIF